MEYFTLGNNKELNLLFVNGTHAYQNKTWGDALFYLERALNILQRDWGTENIDQYEYRMFCEICYMLGFVYMEFEMYPKAIYYLGILHGSEEVKYEIEFINSLSNSKDIRTLGVVNSERQRVESNNNMDDEEKNHVFELPQKKIWLYSYRNGKDKRSCPILYEFINRRKL